MNKPQRKKYEQYIDFDRDTIKDSNGCLNWKWSIRRYPQIRYGNRMWRVSRLLFHFYFGGCQDKYVLHSCYNKLCINPEHLRLGTKNENQQDNDVGKLSARQIPIIRKMYNLYGMTYSAISRVYQIDEKQVRNIIKRKQWHTV